MCDLSNGTMLHPWPRDTGKCTAKGPNIISPEAEGGVMGAEGDIMWPEGGTFSSGTRPGV